MVVILHDDYEYIGEMVYECDRESWGKFADKCRHADICQIIKFIMGYIKLTLFIKYNPNLIKLLVTLMFDLPKHHIHNKWPTHEQGRIR
jgi:hypothetical protein